jgi:predicted phage tail protein
MNNKELTGRKGGGGTTFRNRPDNLRSEDTFEALLGLVTGRIRGLAPGGLKNYLVNDVPLEDGAGNQTLDDFNVLLDVGDPSVNNPIKLQLGGSSGPVTVNLALDNPNPSSPGDWRYATIATPGVDAIDLRFIVSQLFSQTEEGINNATLSIEVELQPSGASTWTNPLASVSAPTYDADGLSTGLIGQVAYLMRTRWEELDVNAWKESTPGVVRVTGKTTQNYVKEVRIAVPNEGDYENVTWEVRCRLVEQDTVVSGSDETRRTALWESAAGVIKGEFGGTEEWRGLAYAVVSGKATDQLTGIPRLEGIFDLAEINVPPASVWDAETRVYTGGMWDGSSTEIKWTQCPAFQLKDLIEDPVSGIASMVPGSSLDKWDTLAASKWYAEQVPDGKGGTHCRYSMNYVINSPMRVNELVQYVAGATGSYAWDRGDGTWRLMVEKPEDSVALFTKEDIQGDFSYSHTEVDSRYNEIIGVFNNEDNRYEEDRVRVYDQGHIDVYGRRSTTLALIGCTSRQEALRRTYLRMLSALNEIRQVSFLTTRKGTLIQPFNVISVADSDLGSSEERTTERLLDITDTEVTLGNPVYLEPGVSYEIQITVPNEEYEAEPVTEPGSDDWRAATKVITRTVTNVSPNTGSVRVLGIDSPLPGDAPEQATVALVATDLPANPKQYRVLAIEPSDDSDEMVSITAVEIYSQKWDISDAITESEIASQKRGEVPSPTDLTLAIDSYSGRFQSRRILSAQWTRPDTDWFDSFRVEYRYNGGPKILLEEQTPDTFVELTDPVDGLYEFFIITKDRRGGESLPLSGNVYLGEVPPAGTSRLEVTPLVVQVDADSSGVPLTDELPVGGNAKFLIGDSDVTDEATWSVTGYGCTATIGVDGIWEITDVATSGKLEISGEFEGTTLVQTVTVNFNLGTAANDRETASLTGRVVSNTTYNSDPGEPLLTINSGASGAITVSSYCNYKTEGVRVTAKISYRPIGGGSWTDISGSVTGTESIVDSEFSPPTTFPGYCTISDAEVTGLTANTDYEIGVFTRTDGSSTTLKGSFTAEGNT